MEGFLPLLAFAILVAPVVALIFAIKARREARALRQELDLARLRLDRLEGGPRREIVALQEQLGRTLQRLDRLDQTPAPLPSQAPEFEVTPAAPAEIPAVEPVEETEAVPPPLPAPHPFPSDPPPPALAPSPVSPAAAPAPAFSLEKFMGAKLFAWLGGLAMFFGVSFFVKYAFDNNLIPPGMRVALGLALGLALAAGGLVLHRKERYRVLAQAFCATGVVVLYGVTFAAHALYRLPGFGDASTFAIMAAITCAAIVTAVRLDALVVAVLGMLGGFLTPALLPTGHDPGLGLFGYVALLDLGLIAVSRTRWRFLRTCAAIGTALTEIFWALFFFKDGNYAVGALTLIPMAVFAGFPAAFALATPSPAAGGGHRWLPTSILAAAAMGFAFSMLAVPSVAKREVLLYGFILLVQLSSIRAAWGGRRTVVATLLAGTGVMLHLAIWIGGNLSEPTLGSTLLLCLFFGVLHSALSFEWLRRFEIGSAFLRGLTCAFGAVPFAVLALAVTQLKLPDPIALFSTAILMAAALVGLGLCHRQPFSLAVALAGLLLVQACWHEENFKSPGTLVWHAAIHLGFVALAFATTRGESAMPWRLAALSGIGHFLLVWHGWHETFPAHRGGWVPAAFALPMLAGVWWLRRGKPPMDPLHRSRLAWTAGSALLFLTLIVPIQFERQWLTLGWALEGAALVWLFRRIPHPGLTLTGLALLVICFVRLVDLSQVLQMPRPALPILNVYLYLYGITLIAHFAAAWWYRDPSPDFAAVHPRGVLNAMGGILAFVLLNLLIADAFTPRAVPRIDFSFSGNFPRDMTLSIAWGVFALALMGLGFALRVRPARYAAIGLLAATLLKVFLVDLATIGNIYRIGALIGVALIAFAASFLYQRFYDRTKGA